MGAEQVPESRSRRSERHEDQREPGHEEPDLAQEARRRAAIAAGLTGLELGRRQPRHHRQVAGDQRQDARGQEREDPGPEGDEHAEGVRRNGTRGHRSPPEHEAVSGERR